MYYDFFHSIATYGIIAWGGTYDNALSCLQRVQNRLIKIIRIKDKNIKLPLCIKECFLLETILLHHNNLSTTFNDSNKSTKNRITLPWIKKTLKLHSGEVVAIKIFNALYPNCKTRERTKSHTIRKLKKWISDNTQKLLNLQLIDKNVLII